MADFARRLERERDQLRAELARLNGQTRWQCQCGGMDCEGQRENERLRAECERLKDAHLKLIADAAHRTSSEVTASERAMHGHAVEALRAEFEKLAITAAQTADRNTDLRAQLAAAQEDNKRYYELLFAVERKFDGESRHETALRYIRQAENLSKSGDAAREGGAR